MMRSYHWSHRAVTEYHRSSRTWLGTITLSPMMHQLIDARVAKEAHVTGASWMTEWSPEELFRRRCKVFGQELTRWLKRIRINATRERGTPPRFKFLLVAEKHQSERTSTTLVGRPHYHILIHEALPFELIAPNEYYTTRKGVVRVHDNAAIRNEWQLGYTQFELCRDERSASYLCKYLAKDMLWRVRASMKYGVVEDETADTGGNSEGTEPGSDEEGSDRRSVDIPQTRLRQLHSTEVEKLDGLDG